MWTTYKNLAGNSGVVAYDYDEEAFTWIKIEFLDGSIYEYTDESCSWLEVLRMIELAESGFMLNRWLVDNDPGYADKTA